MLSCKDEGFHFRVGVRVAVRGFTSLFSAFLIAVILQMYPIAFVTNIALSLFASRPLGETVRGLPQSRCWWLPRK